MAQGPRFALSLGTILAAVVIAVAITMWAGSSDPEERFSCADPASGSDLPTSAFALVLRSATALAERSAEGNAARDRLLLPMNQVRGW
jgi:hypothetical protein